MFLHVTWASLVAWTVKDLPTMQETWVRSLGRGDPLEKGMAIRSSIVAWEIPMDRGTWWAIVHWVARGGQSEQLTLSLFKNFKFFNWKIIALQNCVGFCQTST